MVQIDGALPGHDSKNIQRQQHARGVQLRVGARKEAGNHVGALPLGMALHERKLRIFLVTLGREANIVELDLIGPRTGYILRQGQLVILHFGV